MKNILCLLGHLDDAEIWIGGTIKKHIQMGYNVKVLTFYDNSDIRLQEVKESVKILGYEHLIVNTQNYTLPSYIQILELLNTYIPDILFTHWNNDTHIEHQHIYKLAETLVHHWKRYNKKIPLFLMVSTYFMMGQESLFLPDVVIDIEDFLEIKIKSIECHKSQKVDNLLADIESQHCIFGGLAGIKYGEGFKEKVLFGKKQTLLKYQL